MPDCGTCDYCRYRKTGVMPEPTRFGLLKVNTECRMSYITMNPGNYILRIDPENFMKDKNGYPVLNERGQQVIQIGEMLLCRDAPDGGYLINLKSEELNSKIAWEALGDYLRSTVSLRFDARMKVEIQIA